MDLSHARRHDHNTENRNDSRGIHRDDKDHHPGQGGRVADEDLLTSYYPTSASLSAPQAVREMTCGVDDYPTNVIKSWPLSLRAHVPRPEPGTSTTAPMRYAIGHDVDLRNLRPQPCSKMSPRWLCVTLRSRDATCGAIWPVPTMVISRRTDQIHRARMLLGVKQPSESESEPQPQAEGQAPGRVTPAQQPSYPAPHSAATSLFVIPPPTTTTTTIKKKKKKKKKKEQQQQQQQQQQQKKKNHRQHHHHDHHILASSGPGPGEDQDRDQDLTATVALIAAVDGPDASRHRRSAINQKREGGAQATPKRQKRLRTGTRSGGGGDGDGGGDGGGGGGGVSGVRRTRDPHRKEETTSLDASDDRYGHDQDVVVAGRERHHPTVAGPGARPGGDGTCVLPHMSAVMPTRPAVVVRSRPHTTTTTTPVTSKQLGSGSGSGIGIGVGDEVGISPHSVLPSPQERGNHASPRWSPGVFYATANGNANGNANANANATNALPLRSPPWTISGLLGLGSRGSDGGGLVGLMSGGPGSGPGSWTIPSWPASARGRMDLLRPALDQTLLLETPTSDPPR